MARRTRQTTARRALLLIAVDAGRRGATPEGTSLSIDQFSRYLAVLAVVQDGWKVVEVARRLEVSRQSVHIWIARYEAGGLGSLSDRSHLPRNLPVLAPPTAWSNFAGAGGAETSSAGGSATAAHDTGAADPESGN